MKFTKEELQNITRLSDSVKTHKNKINDEITQNEIEYLLAEERKAVNDYVNAIYKCDDSNALYVLSHILKEETHHIELLENLKKGKVEFKDATKDSSYSYRNVVVIIKKDGTRTFRIDRVDYQAPNDREAQELIDRILDKKNKEFGLKDKNTKEDVVLTRK